MKLIWNKLLTHFITKLPRVFHIFFIFRQTTKLMPSMTTPKTTPFPTTTTTTTTTTRRTTTPYTFTTASTTYLPITFTTPPEVWGEAINDIPVEPTGFMPEVSPMASVLKKVDPFKSPPSSRQKYQGNDGTIANFFPSLKRNS